MGGKALLLPEANTPDRQGQALVVSNSALHSMGDPQPVWGEWGEQVFSPTYSSSLSHSALAHTWTSTCLLLKQNFISLKRKQTKKHSKEPGLQYKTK